MENDKSKCKKINFVSQRLIRLRRKFYIVILIFDFCILNCYSFNLVYFDIFNKIPTPAIKKIIDVPP
jgi:hypothetical protein